MILRRHFLIGAGLAAGTLSAPSVLRAQERVIKMGSLRLIHSMPPHFYEKFAPAGTKIEITTFDSADRRQERRGHQVGRFRHLRHRCRHRWAAAAGEPVVVVGAMSNKGMGVISKAGSDVKTVKDLKGKQVGIWPGSTQEVFIMERLRMEGHVDHATSRAVRVPFGEMHAMLSRGDIDAYVGAEPGPGLSISSGVGQLVEYPYGTGDGRPEHDLRHPRGHRRRATRTWCAPC